MDKYLTTQEAATLANRKDASTIRKAILNGWLKAEKIGKRGLLIERQEFERWLADGRRVYPQKPE